MARKRPVVIWIIRHSPSSDPKFHHVEMLLGVGKSMKELFKILMAGCVFRVIVMGFCS